MRDLHEPEYIFGRSCAALLTAVVLTVLLAASGIAEQSLDELRDAATKGDADSQYALGLAYYSRATNQVVVPAKDDREAIKWFMLAERQNYPGAAWVLGEIFSGNSDGIRDEAEALKWFERWAEHGTAKDKRDLAERCANGFGVPKDLKLAFRWYLRAAESGEPAAQHYVARAYAKGELVTKNEEQAVFWLKKASSERSDAQIDWVAYRASPENGIPIVDSEAVDRIRRPAGDGDPEAEMSLGLAYEHGYGVQRDLEQAKDWYKRAASQGEPLAAVSLGFLYYLPDKNYTEAAKWFEGAAYQGQPAAQKMLSMMLQLGRGVPKNEIEALAWSYICARHDDTGTENIAKVEERLGVDATLRAQQRSAELVKEIDSLKAHKKSARPPKKSV